MIEQPFTLFRPYADRLHIAIFRKEDDVISDENAGQQLDCRRTAGLWQEHGTRTIVVDAPTARTERADGMITHEVNLLLSIRWADCQNFLVYAPEHHVLGVLHAGWRGLVAGAIPAFFETLRTTYDVHPWEVIVGAGPSLCARCADFTDPHRELPTIDLHLINGQSVDLQAAATQQYMELGVEPERFERHPDCTRCNPNRYWTYRGGHREEVKEAHTNMLCCTLLEQM